MRAAFAVLLALPLAAAGQPPDRPADPLEGTWLVEGVEPPPSAPSAGKVARSVVVIGANGDWYFWTGGEPFAVAKAEFHPDTRPSRVTLRFKSLPAGPRAMNGKTWKAIVRAEGDRLTLCADGTGRDFPADFAAPENTPNVLHRLTRLKGEQPEHRARGGADGSPGPPSPLAALRGTWKLKASAGPLEPPTPADAGSCDVLLKLDYGRYTLTVDGAAVEAGRVAVDTMQSPPTMVFVNTTLPEGAVTWAVYEHTGDTLRVCKDAHAKGRPTAVRTAPSAYVQTFERQK